MTRRKHRGGTRVRRGQAEVIGGLIIITILLVFLIPLALQTIGDVVRIGSEAKQAETRIDIRLKEELTIRGTTQDEMGDLWPSVWIENTGTVPVTLRYIYIIDKITGEPVAVLDMANARSDSNNLIQEMILNPDEKLTGPEPPAGEYITLSPGDRLLIVFNATHPLMEDPTKLRIRVLSEEGVLHPKGSGAGGQGDLVPPSEGAEEFQPWKGALSPYAGFKLLGGNEIETNGELTAYQPLIEITEPVEVNFSRTFIYDDPDHPGLYRIYLEPDEFFQIRTNYGRCSVPSGSDVNFLGFIGTYHFYTDSDGNNIVYIYGYATDIVVNGVSCFGEKGLKTIDIEGTWEISDFDVNNVDELVLYSYKNGPNYVPKNVDADRDGDSYEDALMWSYVISRDISGQDFITITLKINYYWTRVFIGESIEPARALRLFAVVTWEYDEITKDWHLRHFRDVTYVNEKPRQFKFTTVFPIDRSKTYRVGIIFYDQYRELGDDDVGNVSWIDFTYGLEYIIVEYGKYNPLFSTTPPIYIVAIPDPAKINNIGEDEYAILEGLTLEEAKVEAQKKLLDLVKSELEFAGLVDYTIVDTASKLCDLLFTLPPGDPAATQPRDAIVFWLQGDVSISDVSDGCADDQFLLDSVKNNSWIFVQVSGEPLWGNLAFFDGPGFNMNYFDTPDVAGLTEAGQNARARFKAFNITFEAEFAYLIEVYPESCIVPQGTFYENNNYSFTRYGTLAFWAGCEQNTGVFIVNPADIDWALDGGGLKPVSAAEIVVYSALQTYMDVMPGW
ncbi:hypothetical protein [Aeropyrum pernix]|uniref:hypothetical protein n=1 Tax=Aeropyrum pernix TaxID=56636 RepID=UPI001037F9F0|nr:hypothetical protein [Aeropyrum pernix]